jgi:hypothetical protein
MWVTNYERLYRSATPNKFDAVVLDESSILKQSTGATRYDADPTGPVTFRTGWPARRPRRPTTPRN